MTWHGGEHYAKKINVKPITIIAIIVIILVNRRLLMVCPYITLMVIGFNFV